MGELMRIKKIVKLFKKGNVCVTGLRGTGKDVLFGNVISRRKHDAYMANLDYGGKYAPFVYSALDVKNTYKEVVNGQIKPYICPLPRGTDVYISDAGVYFPSQYCNELNKAYPSMPVYQALCRQLSRNNFHINSQNLNRVWDKIREQSDIYIRCRWCKIICLPFLGKIVLQGITIYDKYESCVSRVKPCRVCQSLFENKESKAQKQIYRDGFFNQHGEVKNHLLIYKHKSKHDTHAFYQIMKGELNDENQNID